MFNFGDVVWIDSTNLKVQGAAITKGICRSAEGKEFDFTNELMTKILSHFDSAVPIKIGHGDTPEVGRAFKMGYDSTSKSLPFVGHIYGDDKRDEIESHGKNKISPEIDFTFDATGLPIDGVITALALVPIPAMEGTQVSCMPMTFSAPSHPWDYGKDATGSWDKPSLGDFTSKNWGELDEKEKSNIAGHFAYSAELPATSFGDFKFPHHNPKSHAVVWAAVANAMARLKQSSLDSSDRKTVYNHLVKHYKEFDKPVPAMFESDHMKQEGIMVFYPKGTEVVEPITPPVVEPTGSANFEAEISKYKEMSARFEAEAVAAKAEVASAHADVAGLKAVADAKTAENATLAAQINDYKSKVDALTAENSGFIQEKTDVVVAELKTLGFKAPETIAADLPAKQRIEVLKQMKSNFVVNAPGETPTTPVVVPPAKKTGKAAVIESMPEELRKYIKSGE
ncbi:MAG: hypothetical protein WC365_01425 [Candidatus Babeliales bacterium]